MSALRTYLADAHGRGDFAAAAAAMWLPGTPLLGTAHGQTRAIMAAGSEEASAHPAAPGDLSARSTAAEHARDDAPPGFGAVVDAHMAALSLLAALPAASSAPGPAKESVAAAARCATAALQAMLRRGGRDVERAAAPLVVRLATNAVCVARAARDEALVHEAVRQVSRAFTLAATDRAADAARSRRWATYGLAALLFRTYFALGTARLCEPIVRAVRAAGDEAPLFAPSSFALADPSDLIGNRLDTIGNRSDTIGNRLDTIGNRLDTIGNHPDAIGNNTSPIGNHTNAIGNNTSPIGNHTSAFVNQSNTIGNHTGAIGNNTSAIRVQKDHNSDIPNGGHSVGIGRGMPPIERVPRAQAAAFEYYCAQLALHSSRLADAEAHAWRTLWLLHGYTTRDGRRLSPQHRRTLAVLVVVRMARGVLPAPGVLAAWGLDAELGGLADAVRRGDPRAFDAAMASAQAFLLRRGLLLAAQLHLRQQLMLSFVRRAYAAAHVLGAAGPGRLPVAAILAAGRAAGLPWMDADAAECVLANLIHARLVRGYISHARSVLVLARQSPFVRSPQ